MLVVTPDYGGKIDCVVARRVPTVLHKLKRIVVRLVRVVTHVGVFF